MKITKANERDKKIHKKKHGMRVSGKGVFTLQRILKERADKIEKEKNEN